jgi:hypothetical protein
LLRSSFLLNAAATVKAAKNAQESRKPIRARFWHVYLKGRWDRETRHPMPRLLQEALRLGRTGQEARTHSEGEDDEVD